VRKAKRLPLEELAPYLLELSDPPSVFDWPTVFRNTGAVEIEIGFGKGTFLVAASQARREANFVGVEIDRALQLYVANRLAKRGLTNVRLVRADARLFLHDFVADASATALRIYFPDPWWKQRHKKRRIFTAAFAAECQRVLAVGGRLHLATDVEEYFGVMRQLLTLCSRLRPIDEPHSNVLTNFERKAELHGRAVWRAVYEKVRDPA
jgi:tRNA (guanine-N7-)-methyltransferase